MCHIFSVDMLIQAAARKFSHQRIGARHKALFFLLFVMGLIVAAARNNVYRFIFPSSSFTSTCVRKISIQPCIPSKYRREEERMEDLVFLLQSNEEP